MPTAEQKTVSEVFADSKLRVPLYQRSYSWVEQQVEDLLNDIDYVFRRRYGDTRSSNVEGSGSETANTDIYHYFGTIVLNERRTLDRMGAGEWKLYDIIDGQQRLTTANLFIACVIEELELLSRLFEERELNADNLPDGVMRLPGSLATTHTEHYIKLGDDELGRHFEPGELTESAYAELVIDRTDPDSILEDPDRLVPEKKLATAKQIIQDWLHEKRNAYANTVDLEQADSVNLLDYYAALARYTGVLTSQFKLTSQQVEGTDEAGRLFEAVNDRGRDITLADKVKSYLIYISGEFDQLDSESVARRFNSAVETVAQYASDDDDIDQLVQFHWELFTGEYKKIRQNRGQVEIHRRIKESPRHIPLERDPDEVARWVNEYVNTLSSVAESYVQANYLDVFRRRNPDIGIELQARLQSLHNINFSNVAPLIIAAIERYDAESEEFARITTLCEVYSFRVYQVAKRSQRTARREFKETAHRLYGSAFEDDYVEDVFGESVVDLPYENPELAANEVAAFLDKYIGRHCPDNDFVEYLTRSDIIRGSDIRGWPGFSNKSAIRFLLYEYEKHLRKQKDSDSLLVQLPDVMDLDNDFTIEHIAPGTPESDKAALEDHEAHVNRLGNLALLGPNDNTSASNDDYRSKYIDIYEDAQMLMLGEELPNPDEGWNLSALDDRARAIVNFALNHWSGESAATVTLSESSSNEAILSSVDPRTQSAFTIRKDAHETYKREMNASPSRVKIVSQDRPDAPSSGEEHITDLSQCSCGALYANVQFEDSENYSYNCVCGADLDSPNIAGEVNLI